jgi:hypothetical protein
MGGGGKNLNTKDTKGTKETLAGLAVCGFDDPGL